MSTLPSVLLPSLHHNLISTLPHTIAAVAAAASASLAGELYDDLGEFSPRREGGDTVPSDHGTSDGGALSVTSQIPMLSSGTVGPIAQPRPAQLAQRLQLASSPTLEPRSTAPSITPSPQHQQRALSHNTAHFSDGRFHHNVEENNVPSQCGPYSAHYFNYQWPSSTEVPRVFGTQAGYLGTLPPVDQIRARLWFGCLESCMLPPRPPASLGSTAGVDHSATIETGEDVRRALYDALVVLCENTSLPTSHGRGGTGEGATKRASALHHTGKLSTVRTSAKSLVLLLSEVLKPVDVVEGCSYVIADLRRQILDDPSSSVVERSEAAAVAALAVYVKRYWSPVEMPVPTQQAAERMNTGSFEGGSTIEPQGFDQEETLNALHTHIRAAQTKALDVLHHAVYCTDFVVSSLTKATTAAASHATDSNNSSTVAEMFNAVGNVIRVRDALSSDFLINSHDASPCHNKMCDADVTDVRRSAAAAAAAASTLERRFDVAGVLTGPCISDSSVRLGAPGRRNTDGKGRASSETDNDSNHDKRAYHDDIFAYTDVAIPVGASMHLNPLRHFQGTARPSPFSRATSSASLCLVSVGSKCVVLGDTQRTQVTVRSAARGGHVPPTATPFTTVFGTSSAPLWWPTTSAAQQYQDALPPSAAVPLGGAHTPNLSASSAGGGGYYHAIAARGLKDAADEVESPFIVAAASVSQHNGGSIGGALHFFDLGTTEQVHLDSVIHRDSHHTAWNSEVVPSRDHRSHRLEYRQHILTLVACTMPRTNGSRSDTLHLWTTGSPALGLSFDWSAFAIFYPTINERRLNGKRSGSVSNNNNNKKTRCTLLWAEEIDLPSTRRGFCHRQLMAWRRRP
jgi:hypothetical protein